MVRRWSTVSHRLLSSGIRRHIQFFRYAPDVSEEPAASIFQVERKQQMKVQVSPESQYPFYQTTDRRTQEKKKNVNLLRITAPTSKSQPSNYACA
jgi:hypothetical protein